MRIGILGGTFDPIHIAHLHAGECAISQAGLDEVIFMPAGRPWQKGNAIVSPGHHRLEMARLATSGVDRFAVDAREIEREGPTYTIDTLATFDPTDELFLILGADAAIRLPTWHRASEVTRRCTILVAPRPGTSAVDVAEVLPQAVFLDMAILDVSGSGIRQLSAQGRPYRFLVTEDVHRYVEEHHLYPQATEDDMVGESYESEETS